MIETFLVIVCPFVEMGFYSDLKLVMMEISIIKDVISIVMGVYLGGLVLEEVLHLKQPALK